VPPQTEYLPRHDLLLVPVLLESRQYGSRVTGVSEGVGDFERQGNERRLIA
jgi:hypothetical protein